MIFFFPNLGVSSPETPNPPGKCLPVPWDGAKGLIPHPKACASVAKCSRKPKDGDDLAVGVIQQHPKPGMGGQGKAFPPQLSL